LLGLVLIHWVTQLLAAGWGPFPAVDVTMDGRVVVFTIALALVSGLFFGLAPALQATRPDLLAALKGTDSNSTFQEIRNSQSIRSGPGGRLDGPGSNLGAADERRSSLQ